MKTFLFCLIIIFVSASCRNNKDKDDVTTHLTFTRSLTEYTKALNNMSNGDPVDLEDFTIKTDSAYITVSYGGGCKEHNFNVIWSTSFSKTNPPETGIIIVHNANGDNCKALISETLEFNIKDLAGQVAFNTVVINVLNGSLVTDSLTSVWNP